jgi:hypothetical protein
MIRGSVTDPQGALVIAAIVTVTNVETQVSQTSQTNGAGFYLIPELVPGRYKVHLELAGFVPVDVNDVVVKANDVATVDIQMQVGPTAQRVEVTASNPLVETTAANFSTPIEQTYVQDLPLVGRDIQNLVQLVPGVTQSYGPPGSLVAFNSEFGGFPDPTHHAGSLVSVNGGQAGANVWYLDGSLNSAQGADNVVVSPSPDAVSEFQAVNNGFAPEYGRHAGAVFNVVLKSGTNQVHGDAYEYNRNSHFHARNPFYQLNAQGKLPFPNFINWNQFGGTLGGPVYLPHLYKGKNRTFFFVSWDISPLVQRTPGVFTIPTLKERTGDFSEIPSVAQFGIYDPMSTKRDPSSPTGYSRQPFLGPNGSLATRLPASRLDPIALWWINQYPAPNYLDPLQQDASAGGCLNLCNNYLSETGNRQTTHNISFKIDQQIGRKNKFFAEWLVNPTYYRNYKVPWIGPTAPLGGYFRSPSQVATVGDTHAFSPTVFNEFRLTYSRSAQLPSSFPDSIAKFSETTQHIPHGFPLDPPFTVEPTFYVYGTGGGGFLGGRGKSPSEMTDAYTILDNVVKVQGRHTIKAGFVFRDDRNNFASGIPNWAMFGGGLTANAVTGTGGAGWAQFLLGAVDQGSFTATPRNSFWSSHSWAGYIQDDFRVNQKFTINFGLRYDVFEWFRERYHHVGVFDFNGINPAVPTRKGRVIYVATKDHPSDVVFPANKNNWAPRLNFVYFPSNDRKTVVRGGINLIYTNGLTQELGQGQGAILATGYGTQYFSWGQDATGQGLAYTYETPAFLLSQGAPLFPPSPDYRAADTQFVGNFIGTLIKHSADPSVAIWNLQIQRELPANMIVSAGFVGSKGTHLLSELNRTVDYIPTKIRQALRLKLTSELVPTPADLVSIYGPTITLQQSLLRYPQYTSVFDNLNGDGSSSYNAFQLRVEKRYSHGLDFLAGYTKQKTIVSPDLGGYLDFNNYEAIFHGRSAQTGSAGGAPGYYGYFAQNPDNRRADRALSGDDIPQILNLAMTYELPLGPGHSFVGGVAGVPRLLTQGWKISTNFNIQSGVPLAITGPANYLTNRPNLIGDPSAGRSRKSRYQQEQQWFNPNAFEAVFGSDPSLLSAMASGVYPNGAPFDPNAVDALWRFGTAGYRLGNARSPAFWGSDLALLKDFKFSESRYVQFRFEAFNAFNHQSLGLPNNNWCLPPHADGSTDAVHQFGCQFGRITNTQIDARNLEFGLKFVF